MHRPLAVFASLLTCSLLTGCAGLGFELGVPLRESRIMGSPLGGLLGGVVEVPIPLDVNLAAETAARDTGPAQAVRLHDLRFAITSTAEPSGDTDDFAFVEEVRIYVESSASGTELPRVEVAEALRPASGDRSLVFVTDSTVNLLPYVNEGAVLTSEGRGTVPPDDVTYDGSVTLGVEVL